MQLRVSALGRREHQCCHFARSGPALRRLSWLKYFRMLRRLDLSWVRGNRTRCQFDRLKKFRCVRTVSTPNFVLTRRTGEAAATPPHASRSSGFVLNSRPRHREGSSSGNIGFCNSVRSGGIRRRPLPRRARFEHNARLNFRERLRSPCRGPTALTS